MDVAAPPSDPVETDAPPGARVIPERLIAYAFALVILVGAGFLMLPVAVAAGDGASFLTALFTSTSAVCVTGLTVVDTGTYWSPSGRS